MAQVVFCRNAGLAQKRFRNDDWLGLVPAAQRHLFFYTGMYYPLILFFVLLLSAQADSFTLDFQHPEGKESRFADAISLTTDGVVTDVGGKSIGFTYAAGSALQGNRVSGVELTAAGLRINVNAESRDFLLGIPFDTTGIKTTAPLRIIARFQEVKSKKEGGDFGESFEYIGVGVGLREGANENDFSHVKVFGNGGVPNFHSKSGAGTSGSGGTLDDLTITLESRNGHSFRGIFNDKNSTGYLVDVVGGLNNPEAVGVLMFHRNGMNSYTAVLTSVTFEGPDLRRLAQDK